MKSKLFKACCAFALALATSTAMAQFEPRNHLPEEVLPGGILGMQLGDAWDVRNVANLSYFKGCVSPEYSNPELPFNKGCDLLLKGNANFQDVALREKAVVLLKDDKIVYIRVVARMDTSEGSNMAKLARNIQKATGVKVLVDDDRGIAFAHKDVTTEASKRYLESASFLKTEPMISLTPEGDTKVALTYAYFGASLVVDGSTGR